MRQGLNVKRMELIGARLIRFSVDDLKDAMTRPFRTGYQCG